jgi:hypothetical protein
MPWWGSSPNCQIDPDLRDCFVACAPRNDVFVPSGCEGPEIASSFDFPQDERRCSSQDVFMRAEGEGSEIASSHALLATTFSWSLLPGTTLLAITLLRGGISWYARLTCTYTSYRLLTGRRVSNPGRALFEHRAPD